MARWTSQGRFTPVHTGWQQLIHGNCYYMYTSNFVYMVLWFKLGGGSAVNSP